MVVVTFKPDAVMSEVFAIVANEQAQIKVLQSQGRLGAVHLSLPRLAGFIEVFADDEAGAQTTVATLPMSKWWDLDVYPLTAPTQSPGAT